MYKVGIDMGGTRIKIGLVRNGKVVASNILEAASDQSFKVHLPLLERGISQLFPKGEKKDIQAIGVAFPGLVDTAKNAIIDTSSKYTDAPSLNLVRWAQQKFGVPLKIDNDARLACLGEWRYGAGKGVSDMVLLTLGTGIGTAVIMNGQLLRGKHFQAGILGGHFIIDYKDKNHVCSCGKYGCSEAIASMWMIRDLAKGHPQFNKSLLSSANVIDWETILSLSAQNDTLAIILKEHCLQTWAVTLVNLVHAYDPERIVIGGGIMHSGAIVLDYLRDTMEKRAWCPSGPPEVRQADFPDTAALLGATELFAG